MPAADHAHLGERALKERRETAIALEDHLLGLHRDLAHTGSEHDLITEALLGGKHEALALQRLAFPGLEGHQAWIPNPLFLQTVLVLAPTAGEITPAEQYVRTVPACGKIIRLVLQDLVIDLFGSLELAGMVERSREIQPWPQYGLRRTGAKFRKHLERPVVVLEFDVAIAKIVLHPHAARLELGGFFQYLERFVELLARQKHPAKLRVGARVRWVFLDALLEIQDGAVEVAAQAMDAAELEVGLGIVRVVVQHQRQLVEAALEIARPAQQIGD